MAKLPLISVGERFCSMESHVPGQTLWCLSEAVVSKFLLKQSPWKDEKYVLGEQIRSHSNCRNTPTHPLHEYNHLSGMLPSFNLCLINLSSQGTFADCYRENVGEVRAKCSKFLSTYPSNSSNSTKIKRQTIAVLGICHP